MEHLLVCPSNQRAELPGGYIVLFLCCWSWGDYSVPPPRKSHMMINIMIMNDDDGDDDDDVDDAHDGDNDNEDDGNEVLLIHYPVHEL